ncbi:sigma-54-dependent transcriptional regulator [Motilimonas pumila]|uniref:Sigma-54-dependent Fis family transcriptional regulator n=1 Tax=Motilimonas pumila TaxID=2303987 RepID=A0A418YD67_9GAMM|nr:sigma-54 dependent transcriptional regulator [Motilimonas pumila]RJG42456.1 sigma-54-dependent Fis family transcriptional regulator [Motilimonas pumila]
MPKFPNVLIVEDSAPQARLYEQYLKNETLFLHFATTGAQMQQLMTEHNIDLVLLDYKLPDMDGLAALKWMRQNGQECFVIVITGHSSVGIAVDMMREGAKDFIEKPVSASRLKTSVNNLLEQARLQTIVNDFQNTFERNRYHGFIGSSLSMQTVYRIIDSAAPSKATVFITGESGTGKEVCAEAIHAQGPRAKQAFVAINCGAIPKDLMESEIFGHVKGAFTGASSERKGAASQADGGSLFLDELCEMDLDLQTKLLRFIQTGSFKKVGSNKLEQVDVRFICATNRDPLADVASGRFREDLYYRLHVLPLQLPPLREREQDIIAIASDFLLNYSQEEGKQFKQFSAEVEHLFCHQYDWPGNVRQLQNIIRNIVVLHDAETVQLEHLPAPLNQISAQTSAMGQPVQTATASLATPEITEPNQITPLAQVEKQAIEQAINICDGNIPKAAALLDVSPSTIYRKKQTWEQTE